MCEVLDHQAKALVAEENAYIADKLWSHFEDITVKSVQDTQT